MWNMPRSSTEVVIGIIDWLFKSNVESKSLVGLRFPRTYDLSIEHTGEKGYAVRRTLNGTSVISWNPSINSGRWYLEVKLVKANLGSIFLFSGFIYIGSESHGLGKTAWHGFFSSMKRAIHWGEERHTVSFKARTASLCSHTCTLVRKWTQRIGTECLAASAIHLLRTSRSALVLSRRYQFCCPHKDAVQARLLTHNHRPPLI